MKETALQSKIQRVCDHWLTEGRMFTAFEVSLEVKNQGVRERHRNMKASIHEILAKTGSGLQYSRTLMDVGAPAQAWVYHKLSDNPYTYIPLDRSGFGDEAKSAGKTSSTGSDAQPAPVATLRNPRPLQANAASPASNRDGVFGLDSAGRLKVPASLLSQIRLMTGDVVNVYCDELNLCIQLRRPSSLYTEPPRHTLTVDGQGCVTLSHSMLKDAELDGLQSYQVNISGSHINVESIPEDDD